MFKFSNNRKTISEVMKMFSLKSLVVDDSYQRRSVWGEKEKIQLIETILLKLVIPEMFFWRADTDPDTGDSITHIVDGQQRIKAISEFVNNEFRLKTQHLLSQATKDEFSNVNFETLDKVSKGDFWNYELMIIDIDSKANRDDIVTMFRRLNLTNYNLNDAEKRNSLSGDFATLARQLSDSKFWDENKLFSGSDVRRMKDVEFCGTLLLLCRHGIIDQTDQKALNQAYEELQSDYKDAETDKATVESAMGIVLRFLCTEEIKKFLRRKAQLYTLFSVAFYSLREEINIDEAIIERLKQFVKLYSVFNNDLNIDSNMSAAEKQLFELLRKYKLASSEGLNKHTNRMIRFNTLKDFLLKKSTKETVKCEDELYQKISTYSPGLIFEDPEE